MTDHARAIEAGARAKIAETLACAHSAYALTAYRAGAGPAVEYWNKLADAAIASGALVPASAGQHTQLADELDGWHDCADGDVSAGNGHFRLQCVSDSDQQRLNLRATLREAAKALRSMVPASAVAEMRERCAKVADKHAASLDNDWNKKLGVANDLREVAEDIADEIRQLDAAPASGDKPRPADCAKPMECGWHRARTEPEINLWLCDVPGCKHMLNAASSNGGGK